jgi:molybdate transport system substrate-binding protein
MKNMNRWTRVCIVAAIALCSMGCGNQQASKSDAPPTQNSSEVRVAAAANLKLVLEQIGADFQKAHPEVKLNVTYGSSGNFFSQISQSAPFDLFLSADEFYPKQLVEKNLAGRESYFIYATGKLVVWMPASLTLDFQKLGLRALDDKRIRKIDIANPRHAPYGKAAEQALKNANIYEAVKSRLVFGDNIEQTASFARTGAADVGIIAKSLVLAPTLSDAGKYWEVPIDAYDLIHQACVILDQAKNKDAAKKFSDFLQSKPSKENFSKFGYSAP